MADQELIRRIADAALKLSSGDRPGFLAAECSGNKELLDAVQLELDSREEMTSAAEAGAPSHAGSDPSDSFELRDYDDALSSAPGVGLGSQGSQIVAGTLLANRYKLLQILGEGGMGAVWLADQLEPVRRKVAVKLIRTGADSKQVIARFEAERQALAVMDHPHIARILDGGTVEGLGLPFFVMELVKGVPLTRYCDQNRLSVRERLELFIPVCEAIQHAHQKGIIHRDIKPSNILVTVSEQKAVPKVIDFGVAKAIGQSLTDKTLDTALGAIVGTPQYMSPEQASEDQIDIDTRTDVYSLGVVLYELLTGSLPFDRKRLGRAAIFEILRIIREEDPSTPSSKLSTDDGLPSISANRTTEPGRLTRLVRGELDWIVMKSIEKDRTRRYDSASGFAADVRRYLTGEPVQAAPPSRWYRLKKVVRRNRGAVIASSLVLASLLAGIAGTGIGLWKAVKAREAESEQRKQAEAATNQAFQALQSFTDEFVVRQFASRKVLTLNERNILKKALGQWELFAAAQGQSRQSQLIRAEGQFRVANLREQLGESTDSAVNYRQAVEILSAIAANEKPDPPLLRQLSEARVGYAARLRLDGKLDEALQQVNALQAEIREGLSLHADNAELRLAEATAFSTRGVILRAQNHIEEAGQAYSSAEQVMTQLVAASPEDIPLRRLLGTLHNNLGNLLLADGNLEAAEKQYLAGFNSRAQLYELLPGDLESRENLADSHYGLGDLFGKKNDLPRSLLEYRAGLQLLQKLNREFPLVPDYRLRMANLHQNVASVLDQTGDLAGQKAELKSSLELSKSLIDDFPEISAFRDEYACQRSRWGQSLLASGELDAARTELDAAVQMLESLVKEQPGDARFQVDLSRALQNRSGLALLEKRLDEVVQLHARSQQLLAALSLQYPEQGLYQARLMESHWNLAGQLLQAGELKGAERAYLLAIEMNNKFIEKAPAIAKHRLDHARLLMSLGSVYQGRRKLPDAREQYVAAIAIAESLVNELPTDETRKLELAGGLTNLWIIETALKRPDAAASLERATGILEPLAIQDSRSPGVLRAWSGNLVNRSDGLLDEKKFQPALALLDEAVSTLTKLIELAPEDEQASAFLHNALLRRAGCHESLRQFLEAAADWERIAGRQEIGEDVTYRSKMAQSLVRGGESAKAVAIAESLAEVREAPTIFARARIHAMAFGNTGEEAQAVQSLKLLNQLVGMGLDDVQRLRNDPDLKSLQKREDFLELLRSIQ